MTTTDTERLARDLIEQRENLGPRISKLSTNAEPIPWCMIAPTMRTFSNARTSSDPCPTSQSRKDAHHDEHRPRIRRNLGTP